MLPLQKIHAGWCFALLCALLAGCATHVGPVNLYDFGPLPEVNPTNALGSGTVPTALSIAAMQAPAALNSQQMLYRLSYVNDLQTRAYAGSRWSMAPAQLLEQRLKARLAQAGTVVLSGSEGANTLPTLRIEVDQLIQNFSSPQQSEAQLALRATLFNGRIPLAQKSFRQQTAAASADAAGGARAMAEASDALINALIAWLAGMPLQK
ncbi:ABC-type transport auxiliary lipoprotein family protein [Herminiimonas sp. CN]|uniref:ABC-type transport auxiliary lipoprotein family protein n=1 Tax=Herminiimonas sp. CN TaxID=1349818 RepID=UPI000473CBAE|nr:ABC-type transport auxiliary lipoprotein family protein [Herminiimonas sp. CN]